MRSTDDASLVNNLVLFIQGTRAHCACTGLFQGTPEGQVSADAPNLVLIETYVADMLHHKHRQQRQGCSHRDADSAQDRSW